VENFVLLNEYKYRDRDRDLIEDAISTINIKFREIITSTVISTVTDYVSRIKPTDALNNRKIFDMCKKLENDFSIKVVQAIYIILPPSVRQELVQKLSDRYLELLDIVRADRLPQYRMVYAPLTRLTESAVSYTQQFFSHKVKYLGPLRDEPKPLYPISGVTDTKDIGFKGEHTAAVLDAYKNTIIQYIPCNQFTDNIDVPKPIRTTLFSAVLDWLDYMGVASNVNTADKGKLGHEMKVTIQGTSYLHDLTHVGVGVSQVLPILVLSLLAERGSTMIFEQPELHLHPRVQTRLADFFISMVLINKQCIVETHSEYMINRLRYRAIVSNSNEVSNNVIIYFAENQEGRSTYKAIKINNYGGIDSWPKGFFDENEENSRAILLEAMLNRKKEAKRNETKDIS
jgi:predicted ATPase